MKIISVISLIIVLGLAGCGPSEQEKQQAEKGNVKKNIMGTGDIKRPNPADYK